MHKVSGGAYDYFNDMGMPDLLKAIEKVDDYTVKFKLTEPNAPIIANLAMDFATIQSAEYADSSDGQAARRRQFDQKPIGTGPFQFVDYQKDAVIRFKAFPDYWGGKRQIDDLVFAITPDADGALRQAQGRRVPGHGSYPNPADLEAMQGRCRHQAHVAGRPQYRLLAMNVTKPPFDKKEVRQALNMAIDKRRDPQGGLPGRRPEGEEPDPADHLVLQRRVKDYPYNPEKAKEMLEGGGRRRSSRRDLWWMPVQRPYNPNAKRMAEMMQADLAKVGVNAELVTYEWGEYRKRLQAGEHQMGLLGWTGDNGDPDNFFFLLGCTGARDGGQNIAKWCNQGVRGQLIQKAQDAVRQGGAHQALRARCRRSSRKRRRGATIAHSTVFEPIRKKVDGLQGAARSAATNSRRRHRRIS